ncbi:LOW QUALITY PROTEIN: hypothetical protein YC2023_116494 [Brassica napus]
MKKRGHDLKKKMKKRGHDLKKKMKKRGHVSSGYGFSGEHRHLRLVDQTVAAFELWWSLQTTPHQLAIGLTELLCSTTSPPQPKASRWSQMWSSEVSNKAPVLSCDVKNKAYESLLDPHETLDSSELDEQRRP